MHMRQLLEQSGSVRVLVASDGLFHLAFYMLVPYVAGHMAGLGYGAASVGLVLGLRALTQQGLSLVGGYGADRWGSRRVIVCGCLVRAASFVALAFAESIVAITLALLASGVAAALFRPALNAYLVRAIRGERADVFAASAVLNEAGSFLGPLLGMALLGFGFAGVCVVSALLFLAAGSLLGWLLPRDAREAGAPASEGEGLGAALANGRLWLFSLVLSSYFILFQQMYVLIPLEVVSRTGDDRLTGALFAIASTVVIVGQLPLTQLCRRYLTRAGSIAAGLVMMGAAFLVLLLPGLRSPSFMGPVGTVLLLTLGTMLAFPFVREVIPILARERALGAHHGLFETVGGLAAMAGNTLAGRLHDASGTGARDGSAWLFLAALGAASGVAVCGLGRKGLLGDPVRPELADRSPAPSTGA